MASDVLLVAMPNLDLSNPSLALSLLKAGLTRIGISSSVAYWNLSFAERIGYERYKDLEDAASHEPSNWIFSHCLFGHSTEVSDEYLKVLPSARLVPASRLEDYRYARDRAHPFLEEILATKDWSRYRVVGFTSCFEQNTATLALAWRIKELNPDITIVFGGSNCHEEMGRQMINLFPFVDFVCLGEGDEAFPALMQALRDGVVEHALPAGFIGRIDGALIESRASAPIADLNELPYPDFDDYFDALEQSPLRDAIRPTLPLETSRGCWWGQKQHCTFCGLNAMEMKYRSKSAERALREIRAVSDRYLTRMGDKPRVGFTDNILDHHYFKTLLPQLESIPVEFSYEIKANLVKHQVEALAKAGVTIVQAGIESLSTPVLTLMKKGCNRLQNVRILKLCHQFGVYIYWNMLTGFPDEDPKEYESQRDLIDSLFHLQPPNLVSRFMLERFSPYFNDPEAYGIHQVRPDWFYRYIYPFPEPDLARLIYRFRFDFSNGYDPSADTVAMRHLSDRWKEAAGSEYLYATDVDDTLIIWDGRAITEQNSSVFTGYHRLIYLYCDDIRHIRSIERYVEEAGGSPDICRTILDEFVRARLMIREGDQYLGLAVLLIENQATVTAKATEPLAPKTDGPPEIFMDSILRSAPYVTTTSLNGNTFLLDVRRRRVHVLNEMSSVIWGLCSDGVPVSEVVGALIDSLPWESSVLQEDALSIIREFTEQEILIAG